MSGKLALLLAKEIVARRELGELPPLGSSVFKLSPDADWEEMITSINQGMHAPVPEKQLGECLVSASVEGVGKCVVRQVGLPFNVYVATWGKL